jgi:serine/threonine protein kinase
MATIIQPRDELLPGYVLEERIGTGGYAEVWRARAPGGIDKAIKIVNGYYDEEFASQEMKALERIKDVRHPFLLSLERFEVVNGRLAILTELADLSLEQRAQECRVQGLLGIPRPELLQYMADTAEALDYLVQRYGLQHLDIKPANLLILGEHVKVADFGLVKELTTRTQNSLVAGMTPTYASPEMFDDAPSQNSDQYSLAIVYQELLVGERAFPGRTAAQLAKQHTQAQPQLSALPAHDRPIVARALAKNPAERYPTCRVFVDALLRAGDAAHDRSAPSPGDSQGEEISAPAVLEDTKSGSAAATRPNAPASRPIVTQPVGRSPGSAPIPKREPTYAPEDEPIVEETVDVPVPDVDQHLNGAQPTLFIAAGGIGIRILSRLRDMQHGRHTRDGSVDACEMLALDTDRNELKEAYSGRWNNPLVPEDSLHLPLRLPQDYGDDSRGLLAWLSRRWLYNIPRSLETQGYRPLGRIALVDHADKAIALVDRKLKRLVASGGDDGPIPRNTVRVVVVAGMGGGTGAGMVIDLANAARSRAQALGAKAEVCGVLVGTSLGNASSSALAAANTHALLTELSHVSQFGNRGALSQQSGDHPFESHAPPFDYVYCVPAQSRGKGSGVDNTLNAVATYLSLEVGSTADGALRTCRQSPTPKESGSRPSLLLRSFGCARLSEQRRSRFDQVAIELAAYVKSGWLANTPDGEWLGLAKQVETLVAKAAAAAAKEAKGTEGETNFTVEMPPNWLESTRSRFGALRSSRFALSVISQLVGMQARPGGSGLVPLSSKRAQATIAAATLAIAALAEREGRHSDEAASKPAADAANIAALAAEVGNRVLPNILDQLEVLRSDGVGGAQVMEQLLAAECVKLLTERSHGSSAGAQSMLQLCDDDAHQVLQRASIDLLKCGCDRRTLLIVPPSASPSPIQSVVESARPTSSVVTADVEEELIVCEASGIRPRSLAGGLERVYPGIADAAGRLFTRVDIEWQPLT